MWPAHNLEGREAIAILCYGASVTLSSRSAMTNSQLWFRIRFLTSVVSYMTPSDKDAFLDICKRKGIQGGSLTTEQEQDLERLFKKFDERRS